MRVLFVSNLGFALGSGGLQNQIAETAGALSELGVDIQYYSPWKRCLDVDVVHFFSSDPAFLPLMKFYSERNISVICSSVININYGLDFYKQILRLSRFCPGWMVNEKIRLDMFKYVSYFIALGSYEAALLRNLYNVDGGKIEVIPNGISSHFFSNQPVKNRNIDVLYVGRIDKNKNLYTLMLAARSIGVNVVVVGEIVDNAYFEMCRNVGMGNLDYRGVCKYGEHDLIEFYRSSKIVVIPSFREVFPLVALEASVSGCRLIVTKNTTMHDVLRHIGAQVVDPKSEGEIANEILKCLVSWNTREFDSNHYYMYTWDFVAKSVLRIYEEVVNNKSRS